MYIKLSGSLREIQVIFEKCTDGDQGFFINRVQSFFVKNLINEHFADRNRKLVDQSADAQLVITEYILLCLEDLAHFKGCMRLFIRIRKPGNVFGQVTVSNPGRSHCFGI